MCNAPAKVNLCLRIVGAARRRLPSSRLDFRRDRPLRSARPSPERELLPATLASRFRARTPVSRTTPPISPRAPRTRCSPSASVGADVDIAIEKEIPPGAGLGGGSSDAAAVLRSLNTMLGLDVPARRLADLALALGADIPFFLTGGCARVRGIGERVDPIRGWAGHELILALPPIAVSTAWAFRAYAGGFALEPEEPARLATAMRSRPGAPSKRSRNRRRPGPSRDRAGRRGSPRCRRARRAVMSGSGAAVVGLVPPSLSPHAVRETLPKTAPRRPRALRPDPRPPVRPIS